jgi:hypothetical protein
MASLMTAIYCTQAELTAALASLPELIDASGDVVDPRHVVTGLVDRLYAGQKDTAPPAVVVATPTIMAGLVLRWYRDAGAAEYLDAAVVSAGRSGVMLNGGSYLHDIPAGWIADAQRAHEMLRHGQVDRARELATHEPVQAFRGDITEIKR